MKRFIEDERAWADFFITRMGLMLFTAVLLLCAFKIYPAFQEQHAMSGLDSAASDIASKIEAVDIVTVPGYKYVHEFDEENKDKRIEISTEFVVTRANIRTPWGERELVHAEPLVMHVYPPNSNWSNTSGLRRKLSDIGAGKNGDTVSPLDLSDNKEKVDEMFGDIEHELARMPFVPDMDRPLMIEKVLIYYKDGTETEVRDYVLIYQ